MTGALRPRRRGDRGFVVVWTVAIMSAVFMIIAFTLDAGRVVRLRSDAFGTAAAAARAGVQKIDEVAVLDGRLELDDEAAAEAARAYATERGYTATVVVDDLQVTVTVRQSFTKTHLIGLGEIEIDATASAQAIQVDP